MTTKLYLETVSVTASSVHRLPAKTTSAIIIGSDGDQDLCWSVTCSVHICNKKIE